MTPCEVCGVPLDTREAMPQCWGHIHTSAHLCANNLADENARLRAELREWRTGRRRVWWRTDLDTGRGDMDTHLRYIRYVWKKAGAKVRRVTVGPAKPKEAK